jgi:proteasome assembly chaperone (PAC2) family protein
MATQLTTEKPVTAADHHEIADDIKTSDVVADAAIQGQAISGYEGLTVSETVKHFKMATAICFAAAFSAATDGYQIG